MTIYCPSCKKSLPGDPTEPDFFSPIEKQTGGKLLQCRECSVWLSVLRTGRVVPAITRKRSDE